MDSAGISRVPYADERIEFHHVGVACERVDDEIEFWTGLGDRAEGAPFVDGEHGIRARFMTGGGPRSSWSRPSRGR